MNKILTALVLAVVMSGNVYAQNILNEDNYTFDDILPNIVKDKPKIKKKYSDSLHFYCDPKIWERNYKKKKLIAYGIRILKGEYNIETGKTESDYAEEIFLTNNAKFSQKKREVKFDPYFITLRNKSGELVAKIDRTTLKFNRSYFNKDCEVVDSFNTLEKKLREKQKKIEEVRRKNLKF